MHCLIYRTGSLGDAIVTLPALKVFRRNHPHVAVYTLLTKKRTELDATIDCGEIFKYFKLIDNIIYYRSHFHLVTLLARNFIERRFTDLLYLPGERDFLSYCRDIIVFRILSGIKFNRQCFAARSCDVTSKHSESVRLLSAALKNIVDPNFSVQDQIRQLGASVPIVCDRAENFIAVFCDAKSGPSQLHDDRWVEIFSQLSKSNTRTIKVFSRNPRLIYRIQLDYSWIRLENRTLSFHELVHEMRGSDCVIGLDSGPVHLAALLGIRTHVISSSRHHPNKWLPIGQDVKVFRSKISCESCELNQCPKANVCVNNSAIEFCKHLGESGEV